MTEELEFPDLERYFYNEREEYVIDMNVVESRCKLRIFRLLKEE
jgi:hypothetical protein